MISDILKKQRILIFNVNWLGDVLFSTATIRNVRRNFPDAFIACVIPSRCYPVLKGNPHLDEVIIFDEKDRHRGIFAKLNFIRLIKSKKFDTVFLLQSRMSTVNRAEVPVTEETDTSEYQKFGIPAPDVQLAFPELLFPNVTLGL